MQIDWRHVVGAIVLVVWVGQMTGPSLASAAKRLWPKIQSQLSTGKWPGLVILALIGSSFLPHPGPAPAPAPVDPPKPPDLFTTCGIAARELLAEELEKFASQRFDSDQAKEDAINEKIDDVIESSFAPLSDQIAKAIKENRLVDYARKIKAGEAHE